MSAVTAFAGVGSNVEPERNLQLAVAELQKRFGELELSPVYRSPAVGFDGPDFLNLVAAFRTTLAPAAIVREFNDIHELAGRERAANPFTSRTIDIDLLMYGDLVSDEPQLPRGDVLDYAFALKPLSDIAPDTRHPRTGRTLGEHWNEMRDKVSALTVVDVRLGEEDA